MKLSERWVRTFVDPDLSTDDVAEKLTLAGLEVDGLEPAGGALDGFIVAEVRAVEPHPNADRLRLCQVHDGQSELAVVCGAPNVVTGMKAAFAPPGVRLPGGGKIKVSRIRGVESNGMLCSAAELGLGEDAAGLLVLPPGSESGQALATALELPDTIFDIGLTPNRGDCFSVLGVARDLAVISGLPFSEPSVAEVAAATETSFDVVLDAPAACPRYAGRVIEGIDASAATPLWMVERLRRAGVRCLHPLVDVTNYVMLELGQPMHAFDLDRLTDGIIVREARAGETLMLLDGQTIDLAAGTLVIADHAGPVALAGVMGGDASAVQDNTTRVFLESAFFDPVRLAGVARDYRLHTDASTRFERGVDPTMQARAIERATALILEICGGTPGPTVVTESPAQVPVRAAVGFRPEAVARLLGVDVPADTIRTVLDALGMHVETGPAHWQVTPPAFRFDIGLEADLVEEVARITGYDQIPVRLPRAAAAPALPVAATASEAQLRETLVSRGYFEAVTYSFVDAGLAAAFAPAATVTTLANPISSEMSVMRPGLWPGLLGAARYNINRQADDVRLFEIGQVFADRDGAFAQIQQIGGLRVGYAAGQQWSQTQRETDFFDVKQDVEVLFKNISKVRPTFRPATHPALHPGQCAEVLLEGVSRGFLGALHPALLRRYDIDRPLFLFEFGLSADDGAAVPQFQPISRFPAVRRDLSIVVDAEVSAEACLQAAREGAGANLRDLQLFDVYRGQGIDSDKKSLTLGLIFQNVSSTLTDDEVEAAVTRALTMLKSRVGGALRD